MMSYFEIIPFDLISYLFTYCCDGITGLSNFLQFDPVTLVLTSRDIFPLGDGLFAFDPINLESLDEYLISVHSISDSILREKIYFGVSLIILSAGRCGIFRERSCQSSGGGRDLTIPEKYEYLKYFYFDSETPIRKYISPKTVPLDSDVCNCGEQLVWHLTRPFKGRRIGESGGYGHIDPMYGAVKNNHRGIISFLIWAEWNVWYPSECEETFYADSPFIRANEEGNLEMVGYLMQFLPEDYVYISAAAYAIHHKHFHILEYYKEKKIDLTKRTTMSNEGFNEKYQLIEFPSS